MKARQRLFLMEEIIYILAALGFYLSVFLIGTVLGDTSTLAKMFPAIITYCLPTYILFVLHLIMFPTNPDKLHKTIKVNGLVMAGLALASLIIVIVYLATGVYNSLVEGTVTILYPLDLILIDLLVMALGLWIFLGERKMQDSDFEYFPPRGKLAYKIINSIVKPILCLIALFFFGALLTGFGYINYGSATAAAMIPFYVLFVLMSGPFLLDDYLFRGEQVSEKLKKKTAIIYSSLLAADLVALIICWALIPNLLVYEGQAIFFPDYMLEKLFAPYFVLVPPVIEIVYLLLKAFKKKA